MKVINPVREQMLRVLGHPEANALVHSDLNRLSSST